MSFKIFITRIPVLGKLLLFFYRFIIAFKYLSGTLKHFTIWLFKSNETTNFTYDLEDLNIKYLISLIAEITKKNITEITEYINEIINNKDLKDHIAKYTKKSKESHLADRVPRFGRRIGWYAIIRAKKPKIVVETGVDKGLGSCIIAAALIKNKTEGYTGKYFGTDIKSTAGYLFDETYKNYGEILFGDSIKSLKNLNKKIDVFINDSDHSFVYEWNEYQTIKNKLSKDSVIIGDNSHGNEMLLKFSLENKRKFLFFKESPKNHWYPGGGIGISYK